jgi:AraC family transcriptional regulator of adaptative response/methylated-DNA-[protein]-cysteine methyltransferase
LAQAHRRRKVGAMNSRPRSATKKTGWGGEEIRFAVGRSTLGAILVASSEKGVATIMVGDDEDQLLERLQERMPEAHLFRGDREDAALLARVIRYVESPVGELELTLDIRGTPFQRRVWKAVREVPCGQTSTYAEIARQIGAPKAMRAVGTACANSQHAVAIPCHRVLRSDGSFAGGTYWSDGRHDKMIRREAAACGRPDACR